VKLEFDLPEHEPYGLKDERVRALVVSSMLGGDSGQAGVFSTPMRSFAHFNQLVALVKPDLDKVRQPALIIHPRDDDMASLKNAQYLQANLGGLVDTVVLNDSYHMVTLDQQRHVVAERSTEFVMRIEAAARSAAEARSLRGARAD
jgi:carboxylesterase